MLRGTLERIVTLLRPPIVSSRSSFSIPVTPALAIAYLAASLEQAGYETDAIDAIGEDIHNLEHHDRGRRSQGLSFDRIIERIDPRTDILGVSIMFSQEWPIIRELIRRIRSAYPGVTIVAGGEHITALPEFCLADCPELDICALGEGEETIVELVGAVRNGSLLENVGGICFRKDGEPHRGAPHRTPIRKRIKAVDEIPWPAWSKLPIEAYLEAGYGNGINNGRNMPILATRGCPYECTFCSNPVMYGTKYLMRDPADVIAEMRHYVERYRATMIEFYDLTAIIKKEWILRFCNLYLENGLTVGWSLPSGTRSEALDEEVLSLLYRTNCRYLVYAPESGSPETLKEIKKKVKIEALLKSVSAAHALGIHTRCNLIIGFPRETTRQVFETLRFQLLLAWRGVDDAPIYMFSPYPGTELFDYLRGSGQIAELDDDYFDRLLAQMDLGAKDTFCEKIPGRTLRAYRITGMSAFYLLSYLLRPLRILRSFHNIAIRKMTNTVFEQRVMEMIWRFRRSAFVSE